MCWMELPLPLTFFRGNEECLLWRLFHVEKLYIFFRVSVELFLLLLIRSRIICFDRSKDELFQSFFFHSVNRFHFNMKMSVITSRLHKNFIHQTNNNDCERVEVLKLKIFIHHRLIIIKSTISCDVTSEMWFKLKPVKISHRHGSPLWICVKNIFWHSSPVLFDCFKVTSSVMPATKKC